MTDPKKSNHCSPARYEHGQTYGTCLNKMELLKVAKTANIKVSPQTPKKALTKTIKKTLAPKCGDKETCWLKNITPTERQQILSKAFRPEKPADWIKNPRKWLNTYDILRVMSQYEARYKTFKFLGVYPIDFTVKDDSGVCIGDSLCDFHINTLLAQKKKKFGLILNLDKHTQGGSHWVAMFCNLNPKSKRNFGIYYYDSVAHPPDLFNKEKYVTNFMNSIVQQVQQTFPTATASKFKSHHNTIQRQFKNTECGNFSQVFITQMLKDIPFLEICQRMPKDDKIQEARDIFYRPPNSVVTN